MACAGISFAQQGLPVRTNRLEFTSAHGDTLFVLPPSWIIQDSLSVSRRGHQLEPLRDYRLISPGNQLWLFAPLAPGDTLEVRFKRWPLPLVQTYAHRSLRELERYVPGSDSTFENLSSSVAREEPAWSSLRRSGSLIRSVQIGTNQDVSFESALSLQVEGKVGSNVDVVAALSDQDLPIQPEGTTESIRELDKVYVTARSPHLEATIGDYELRFAGRRYDSYGRKLSGLQLGGKLTQGSATISAAVSRGEFNTNRFSGAESVQGPYPLTGKNGENGIVVLAGTERVWLDGAEVRRGVENDYVIDYSAGQISFTPKRLITSDSRIVVEFQYANEDFERQYLAARTEWNAPRSPVNAYVTYISESDDFSRPLGLSFDDEDKSKLEAAGDSTTDALSAAADSLGLNGGDYVRVDTTVQGEAYSIFVYAAPDTDGVPQGQWQVFFDDFGAGNGDYSAAGDELGRTFFEWVGPNAGRYLPARRLPLPTHAELVAFRLDRSRSQGLRGNIEVATSRFDLNTQSALDDADNDGVAGGAEIGFDRAELRLGSFALRQFSASVGGRARGKSFTDVSRSDEIEFDRDWAVDRARQAAEKIGEANLSLSPVQNLLLRGGAGILDRENVLDSKRHNFGATFSSGQLLALRADHLAIDSRDSLNDARVNWIRQNLTGSSRWRMLAPRAVLNHEQRRNDSRTTAGGFRFTDWNVGNTWFVSEFVNLDGEYGLRRDESRGTDGEFSSSSNAKSYAGQLRWQPLDVGRGSLRWVHRDKSFAMSDSASLTSDAGRLELLLTPRNRIFELNLLYDALKSRTEEQLQVFIPVTPGTGDYRLENGVYVPDNQGDYVLVSRNTGGFAPSSEIRSDATLWFRPDETRAQGSELWRKFAFETEASVEERTRLPLTLSLLFLDRGKLRSSETIDGRFSLRQDVHYNRLSRKLSLRLRALNSAAQISRYTNGGQQSVRQEGSLRARFMYAPKLRAEIEASSDLDRTIYEGIAIASVDVRRDEMKHDVLWTLSERWETGLLLSAAESRDERSRSQASIREAAPRVSYTRFKQGRLDAEIHWLNVTSNQKRLPQELAAGANRGANFRWQMRGTIALSSMFSGSLNYSGNLDAGESVRHLGRVEVRATF